MKLFGLATPILALATVTCSNLPDIAEGVCGNQILDATEDCDTFAEQGAGTRCGAAGSANACVYVCDAETVCPTGWGCGQDKRCRQPLGAVEPAPGSPWRFKVGSFSIGDVDGDGNADLIGANESTVSVRFGTATGEFPVDMDVSTRQPQGPIRFVHFDDDTRLDVVVPIFSGIFVMLGQADRTLLPVAYSPFSLPGSAASAMRLVPLESEPGDVNTELLVMFSDGTGSAMAFRSALGNAVPLPMLHQVEEIAGRVPVAELGGAGDGRQELALAFADETRVFVMTSSSAGGTLRMATPPTIVALPAGTNVRFGAQFADVDGDGAIDLLVSVRDDAGDHVAVAYNDGAGELLPAVIEAVFDTLQPAPWPLAAGDLNFDGKADYVSGDAIWIADLEETPAIGPPRSLTPTAFQTSGGFLAAWAVATLGDFNGDGIPDVAAALESVDGVDVLLGTGVGLFNKFHVDTDGPPLLLRAGDFDGDFVGDLAVAESGVQAEPDELVVIFGATAGGPAEPISMGELAFIDQVEPLHQAADIETVDFILDILVLSVDFPDRDARSIALLQGNSQRRLLSPFALQEEVSPGQSELDVPTGLVVGNFAEVAGAASNPRDIVAVATTLYGPEIDTTVVTNEPHIWLCPGEGSSGGLSATQRRRFTAPDAGTFEVGCAEWAAGDIDGDGWDDFVGIDGALRCHGFGASPPPRLAFATLGGSAETTPELMVTDIGSDFTAVAELHLADLDADGDLDLLALFAGEARVLPGESGPAAGSSVAVFWNQDGALAADTPSWFQVPGAYIYSVAAMSLSASVSPEVVVMADGAIYWVALDGATATYGEPVVLVEQNADGRMAVGDVNGDGLFDLAWTEGFDVHVALGQAAPPLGAPVVAYDMDDTTDGGL
jgi:hypothetical protein